MAHRAFVTLDPPLIAARQPFCHKPLGDESPYQLNYLGGHFPAVEKIICAINAAFGVVLQPDAKLYRPFVWDFIASLWVYVTVPLVESLRGGSQISLTTLIPVQFAAQALTGGVVLPVFWILLLFRLPREAKGETISKGNAESIVFAITYGYLFISIILLLRPTVGMIILWQVFPLVVGGLIVLYPRLSSHSTSRWHTPGNDLIYSLYALIFITSTTTHLHSLLSLDYSFAKLVHMWIPRMVAPIPGDSPAALMVDILQWDAAVIFGSMMIAATWLTAKSSRERIIIVGWCVVGSVLVGPGGALSVVWWWREKRLLVGAAQSGQRS